MANIKAIKAELLELAGGEKAPRGFVQQEDIFDMMLKDYFNPASRVSKKETIETLAMATSFSKENARDVSEAEVKAILDKYKP